MSIVITTTYILTALGIIYFVLYFSVVSALLIHCAMMELWSIIKQIAGISENING